MAFRIQKPQETAPVKPARAKRKAYLVWLHSLPCAASGRSPVEAAHLSFANESLGHFGRGKSQKAADRWALPLHPTLHAKQHDMNERAFWEGRGVNPHILALTLWGLYSDYDEHEATRLATNIILNRVVKGMVG